MISKFSFSTNWRAAIPLLSLGLFLNCAEKPKEDDPSVNLLQGETFDGWTILGGDANYRVEDSVIIGSTVHNTPNTFLTTDEKYCDFIFEVDYKVDPSMNSGIQIRSNSIEEYKDGRVHGYQVEIDPSERAWSGGIYDEGRRGWLVPLTGNTEAQQAFKQNEWNTYRIEAIGDTIQTWINGVPAAHLIDDKTACGFIGLQVHSIGDDDKEGTEIKWKNVTILTENLDQYNQEMSLEPVKTKNNLTVSEKEDGWKMLWDGETTEGWRGARLDSFPDKGWVIEDGKLIVLDTG